MADLQNRGIILLKGWLFLLIAAISFVLLALKLADIQSILLLTICVWSACRFYYFAFYVIQHYVDDRYRFAGLLDFVSYLWNSRNSNTTRKP